MTKFWTTDYEVFLSTGVFEGRNYVYHMQRCPSHSGNHVLGKSVHSLVTLHQSRLSFQVQGLYGHLSPIYPFAPMSSLHQKLYDCSPLTIQAGYYSRCLKYLTPLRGWTFPHPVHLARRCYHFLYKGGRLLILSK